VNYPADYSILTWKKSEKIICLNTWSKRKSVNQIHSNINIKEAKDPEEKETDAFF
jgi:hypothetical protein